MEPDGLPADLRGTVHGDRIVLEEPLPQLEGKRVRLRLEVIRDSDVSIAPPALQEAWDAWIALGRDGPMDDDGPDWP